MRGHDVIFGLSTVRLVLHVGTNEEFTIGIRHPMLGHNGAPNLHPSSYVLAVHRSGLGGEINLNDLPNPTHASSTQGAVADDDSVSSTQCVCIIRLWYGTGTPPWQQGQGRTRRTPPSARLCVK